MAREWEARLYDANGKRMYLPEAWIDSVEFEHLENFGMGQGSITLLVPWETLQLTGSEHVDVYLWNTLAYRGWVRIPQAEVGSPERKTLGLYGLSQTLNGYRIRRNMAYVTPPNIADVFSDIGNNWVKRTGRLPAIVIDTDDAPALGLTIPSFDPSGKSVTQAMNDLVGMAPGSLLWGCDFDNTGADRLHIAQRKAGRKHTYAVGDKVQALVYPLDTTQVVNALYVTGGLVDSPNLIPNGSFEKQVSPDEVTANVLLSASFEDASGGSFPNWTGAGNPTSYSGAARTGVVSAKIDNNPGYPETLSQSTVYLPALPATANWSVYGRTLTGQVWHLNVLLELLNSGGTVLTSQAFGPFLANDDETWHRYAGAWTMPATAGAVRLRITFGLNAGDTGGGGVDDGLELDDAALWFGVVTADSWHPGWSSNADFTDLDWGSQAPATPYDGDLCVRVTPNILSAGGYAEIAVTPAAAVSVKANHTYTIAAYVSGSAISPPIVALGWHGYTGSTFGGTLAGPQISIGSGNWSLITFQLTAANLPDETVLPFIRFYNNNPCSVDAFGLYDGPVPALPWYPADKVYARRTVLDYAGSISAAAAASISNYGLVEDEVTNDQILDQATLDAFLIGYFNAHAVPNVQAKLTLFGPTEILWLDGTVQVVNVPDEPPPLFPSRVRYKLAESITIEADLGNQRPDLAGLLRAAANQVLR